MPPKSPFRTGTTGDRSSSFDVTASQLMQRTNDTQDVEYYQSIHGDPPYDTTRWYIADGLIREFIREAMNEIKGPAVADEPDHEHEVDEFSAVGGIAGYTGPLGAANHGTEAYRQALKQNKTPGKKRRKKTPSS